MTSKAEHTAFPELTRAQLEEMLLLRNQQHAELTATILDLLDKMEAHKPLRVTAARRARSALARCSSRVEQPHA
jgi:hypothetical protein